MVKKLLDSAKKPASKKSIQKTAEATDLIGNKIVDKITSASKKSSAEHSMELHSKHDDANSKIEEPKKDTYLQKKGNKLLKN